MLNWILRRAEPPLERACGILSELARSRRNFYTDVDPYLTRFYFTKRGSRRKFRVYLQYFHRGDDDGALHNHPGWSCTLVITNGFVEERWDPSTRNVESRRLPPGAISVIHLDEFHRVRLIDRKRGAWTLAITGKRVQEAWGFWWPGTGGVTGFVPHFRFFRSRVRYGRPC
jgi:hypothetical protein